MKIIIYQDIKKEWRWQLKAKNGRIIACSGEGYKQKSTMEKTLNRIFEQVCLWGGIK